MDNDVMGLEPRNKIIRKALMSSVNTQRAFRPWPNFLSISLFHSPNFRFLRNLTFYSSSSPPPKSRIFPLLHHLQTHPTYLLANRFYSSLSLSLSVCVSTKLANHSTGDFNSSCVPQQELLVHLELLSPSHHGCRRFLCKSEHPPQLLQPGYSTIRSSGHCCNALT